MKDELILNINAEKETKKIIQFIKSSLKKEKFKKVIIGFSGGIDSTTCLYLLTKTVNPENIIVVSLPYFKKNDRQVNSLLGKLNIPLKNYFIYSIKKPVDEYLELLKLEDKKNLFDKIRVGNVMARARMTVLYDLIKIHQALVCGTENKSESLLGYFTRFGDEASDIEPIKHLYKTQVYQLAKYLKVPEKIIKQAPSAGLWLGQTDEGELGFTYKEADLVFYYYLEKKLSLKKIKEMGFKNAEKIIAQYRKNLYKHRLPYELD